MIKPLPLSKIKAIGDGYAFLWTGLWLVLMVTALKFRPLLPVDETRYLAVAWEMWRDLATFPMRRQDSGFHQQVKGGEILGQ